MFVERLTVLDNRADWDGAVYGSVWETSTEVMLQPYADRHKVMKTAWLGMFGFILLVLPFTILPTFLITLLGLVIIGGVAPGWQNSSFTLGAIGLLWVMAIAAIVWLIWKAIEDSGYKTFTFDRLQKQLVINTATIIGRKVVKTIPFNQIRDAQFLEERHDGISMRVWLILDDWEILGLTHPNTIVLSAFATITNIETVQTLTASKHHQELLLLVRSTLGFSTQEIEAQVRRIPAIPTAAELKQQQNQAIADAVDSLQKIARLTFTSPAAKLTELASLRTKTLTDPDNPQAWEQFALALSIQKNPPKSEIISAYQRAEALYLAQGNIVNADAITHTLKLLGAKKQVITNIN
jgi:hypothetical protein